MGLEIGYGPGLFVRMREQLQCFAQMDADHPEVPKYQYSQGKFLQLKKVCKDDPSCRLARSADLGELFGHWR